MKNEGSAKRDFAWLVDQAIKRGREQDRLQGLPYRLRDRIEDKCCRLYARLASLTWLRV